MPGESGGLPPRLLEIVEEFAASEGREKLHLLLEYADSLPALPAWLRERHGEMQPVHECMTPVAIYGERRDGGMRYYFDVPAESPTVRGYAAILGDGLEGATPEEILAVPNTFFQDMGLDEVLTHQRLNGLAAMLAHVKRLAVEAL
ncbi:MAG TPA: SufE family protein [Anaerolineae bacterium]|nr:SufE family protein [Anaerolineae bacterium]